MDNLPYRENSNTISSEKITRLIEQKQYFQIKRRLADILPFDITEIIEPLETGQKVIVFRLLNKETAAEVFSHLEHEYQEELLTHFGMDTVKEIIEEMDPDDRTELFDELPDEMVKRLIRFLSPEERKIVNKLLGYPEDSAGRLMTPEFIELNRAGTAEEAIQKIRRIGLDKETIYYSYVVDEKGFLNGIVSLKDLLLARPDTKIQDIMTTNYVYVNIDDVVDVIHQEATEDFHKMAGIEAPDEPYFSTKFLILGRKRAIWLVVLLVASYLSSVVLKNYSSILQVIIPLAFFIPMLTGTCGNTGMQSATLIIRGLATGEIEMKDFLRIFLREILMGTFLGIILGLFSFVRAHFIDVNPFIGIAVGLAVFISVIAANVIGTILPIILKKLKIDPAISAGPFISTIIDVTSLLIYFEVAGTIFHIKP
jgi:magnesium transporter